MDLSQHLSIIRGFQGPSPTGSARYLRVFKGPLGTKKDQHLLRGGGENTYGQMELSRMPSRAWTMASSRVMARTAPFEAVSVHPNRQKIRQYVARRATDEDE